MGAVVQPRSPRMTSMPSMSGSPRSRMTRSGGCEAAVASALGPGGSREHLVVAGPQVDGQGPQDLRLVVDHQDAAHRDSAAWSTRWLVSRALSRSRRPGSCCRRLAGGDAGSDTTIVSPPPGVSSGVERAAHGLGEPAGQGEPEADAGGVVGVAEALERGEDPVELGRRDARAAVDDPQLDAFAEAAAGDQRWAVGRAESDGVADQVGDDPLEQAGVGEHLRQVVGHVDHDDRARPGRGRPAPAAPPRRGRPSG